jgi:hypothetical protein
MEALIALIENNYITRGVDLSSYALAPPPSLRFDSLIDMFLYAF